MARPDVAIISPYPAPRGDGGRSGVAPYSARLAAALAAEGASVTVVAESADGAPRRMRENGVEVERRFKLGAGALPLAARAAIATGAPVVHLQHEFFLYGGAESVPGLPLALGALRAGGTGPIVTMHHGVDPRTVDASFMRLHRVRAPALLGRAALGSTQRLIRRIARRVIVHEPLFAARIRGATVVPHGLEPAAGATVDAAAARRSLGLDDRFTALCLGYIAPYKGLETALGAAERAGGELQLVIAGGDHPRLAAGADPYADGLRARWGRVARFLGYVPDEGLARLFAATDVALFPYPTVFSASGSLALAVAHGKPVLLSRPLAEAVRAPSELAFPLDPAGLAARLRRLARDRGGLEQIARATAELRRGRSWPEVARAHLRIYEEVIGATRAPGRLLRAA